MIKAVAELDNIRRRFGVGRVSGFSADWLTLREPYDLRARNPAVLNAVVESFKNADAIGVTDLGCGTGSMLRALAPRFPKPQDWRLFDDDVSLLRQATATPRLGAGTVTCVPVDLSCGLEPVLGAPVDIVTTSALLDLVSESWLERLIIKLAARSIPLYATLSYDGRTELNPVDWFDAAILAAVDAHQRTDKGFGPALGTSSASFAIMRLEALGYSVVQGTSDWVIGASDRAIQFEILSGWAAAARQTGESRGNIAGWLTRRRKLVASGKSSMRIGHVDFWARQTGTLCADKSQSNNAASPMRCARTPPKARAAAP